jgi:2-octaprenylphenol hydroxylase
MKEHSDIAIVGAGVVGATLAALLADRGMRVALVDAAPPVADWPAGSIDLRVLALTSASERILAGLGVWPRIAGLGAAPFRDMRVWDARGPGEIHFDSAELGAAQLGHIVENRVIVRALLEDLRGRDGVRLHHSVAVEGLDIGADDACLRLAGGGEVRARLVVGADGANSRLRALGGLEVRGWDYDQRALVATVATEESHRDTAWQRFLPDGPLAFLPLHDGRCSIVWSTRPAHAEALLALDEAAFTAELTEAFAARLGRVTGCGPRAAFPLRLQYAPRYVAARLALVGDAAHAIHPLAGQGANLGLLDAAALAEVVADAAAAGRDVGGFAVLRRYERWRKSDNLATMRAMDGFKRLFGTDLAPLRWARNAGLNFTDAAAPLKNLIAQYAMGLRGDLPRAARGMRV